MRYFADISDIGVICIEKQCGLELLLSVKASYHLWNFQNGQCLLYQWQNPMEL